jgi:hypothetical protein
MAKLQDLPQVKALNWYMDFLADNLETISRFELSKRVVEVRNYIINYAHFTPFPFFPKWPEIDPIDYSLHDELDGTASPEGFPWKEALTKVQTELLNLLEELLSVEKGKRIRVQQVERQIVVFDEKFIIGHPLPNTDYNDCFDLDVLPQLAQISFTDALSGMPRKAIKKCEHEKKCGNYFLHLSEKPKYYCSPKCTSRALAQERRDAEKMAKKEGMSVKKAREKIKKRKAQKRKEGKNGN